MESTEETDVVTTDGTDPPEQPRSRRRNNLIIAASAVVLVALIFAAGILFGRTSSTGSASSTPSASVDARYTAAMVFVKCIRDKGVTSYPDPQPNGELLLTNDSGVDVTSAAYQAAESACKQYLPQGMTQGQPQDQGGGGASGEPSRSSRDLTDYVSCIRGKGVTQFPDPDALGNFSNVDPNWPGLQEAQSACAKFLPSGAPGAPK